MRTEAGVDGGAETGARRGNDSSDFQRFRKTCRARGDTWITARTGRVFSPGEESDIARAATPRPVRRVSVSEPDRPSLRLDAGHPGDEARRLRFLAQGLQAS